MNVENFIQGLEISYPKEKFPKPVRFKTAIEEDVPQDGAYISDKTVVSFVSGVTSDNRQDVLNSTLLAQLRADKLYPNNTDIANWYKTYVDVLGKIGWVVQGKSFKVHNESNALFEMEASIIDIITLAFGANYITIIKKTLEAIKGLADGDGRIKVFEKNTSNASTGIFQISVVEESANGAIAMSLGSFSLNSQNQVTRVLFFKSAKDKTTMTYNTSACTLNTETYAANARQAVKTKLGIEIANYIAEIEI